MFAALRLVLGAGGVPVFAHPRATRRGRVVPDALIVELAAAGLFGLEADHHGPLRRASARTCARSPPSSGLVVTGSSDFHGTHKTVRLGAQTDRARGAASGSSAAASGVTPCWVRSPATAYLDRVDAKLFGEVFVTLLVIIDPPGMVPIFLALTGAMPARDRTIGRQPGGGAGARRHRGVRGRRADDARLPARRPAGAAGRGRAAAGAGRAGAAHRQGRRPRASRPRRTSRWCRSARRCWPAPARSWRRCCSCSGPPASPDYLSIALGIVAVMVAVWLVLRFSGVHREGAAAQRHRGADPDRRPAARRDRGAADRRLGRAPSSSSSCESH